jgi:small-conductance mechanosensitive channel
MSERAFAYLPKIVVAWLARGAAAFFATVLLIWLLARLGAVLQSVVKRIDARVARRGRGLGYGTVEVLSVESIQKLVGSAVGAVRVALTLAALYVWILAVAWALDKGGHVFPLVVKPFVGAVSTIWTAAVDFIPNLIVLVVIVWVTRFLTRTVDLFAEAISEQKLHVAGLDPDLATPTRRLIVLGIWAIAVVMAVPYLPGSDSRAFQGVAVILGLLVSLGSSSVVANLLSGLVLTYTRAYRIGDRVKIGDVVGDVLSLGTFTTRVRTTRDEEVVIPNAVVQSAAIVNYSRFCANERGVQIGTQVTIGYEVAWRRIHRLLILAARKTPGIKGEPEPYVLQRALEDFYVRYEIRAYTDRANEIHLIEAALCQQIQDEFFREGVEICSPHFEAKREGKVQIPEEMRGDPAPTVRPPPVAPR